MSGRKLLRGIIVYHVFNDGEEEGRPPTPGPVGVWLLEGEEEEVVCEVEEKDSTSPVDMMEDTMPLDTLGEDELPTVEDTQPGSWCIVELKDTADDIQVLTMRTSTSRGGFRPIPVLSRTVPLICRIGTLSTG